MLALRSSKSHATDVEQALGKGRKGATYFTLEKTMSTSVPVTPLPSITLHSLHSLAQFFPVISCPVALVSP